jgi:polar amino acid transport system permease protein
MGYDWDFGMILSYQWLWKTGLKMTLIYSITSIFGGLVIGIVLGSAMLTDQKLLQAPIRMYIQLFRCTPLLVQIVWFYYALPIVLNVNLPSWLAGGIGLTLYMGAFSSEIFRGGVMSIDKGQWQAARALGMTYLQMMRRIILPQAARRMLNPVINQSVLQVKNTSLLSFVAITDLMHASQSIVAETYRPLEAYTVVAAFYFVLIYPLVKLAETLERRADV